MAQKSQRRNAQMEKKKKKKRVTTLLHCQRELKSFQLLHDILMTHDS